MFCSYLTDLFWTFLIPYINFISRGRVPSNCVKLRRKLNECHILTVRAVFTLFTNCVELSRKLNECHILTVRTVFTLFTSNTSTLSVCNLLVSVQFCHYVCVCVCVCMSLGVKLVLKVIFINHYQIKKLLEVEFWKIWRVRSTYFSNHWWDRILIDTTEWTATCLKQEN